MSQAIGKTKSGSQTIAPKQTPSFPKIHKLQAIVFVRMTCTRLISSQVGTTFNAHCIRLSARVPMTKHHADDRPQCGVALRHPAAADRRYAVRCIRPAPDHAVTHSAQQLPRDPGDQALTLFTTPVVYLYLDRLSNWLADWRRSANPGRQRPPAEPCAIKQAAE